MGFWMFLDNTLDCVRSGAYRNCSQPVHLSDFRVQLGLYQIGLPPVAFFLDRSGFRGLNGLL